jgi:hypothetical protein
MPRFFVAVLRALPIARLMLALGVAAVVVIGAQAREIMQNTACEVPEESVVEGNLFVLCETLTINGSVRGSVIGIALRTSVNGTVDDSLYLLGFELAVSGAVRGSLHYAGITLNIHAASPPAALPAAAEDTAPPDASAEPAPPQVGGSVLAGALRAQLAQDAAVGAIISTAYQWEIDGTVLGEVSMWGSRLELSGTVDGSVYANVGDPASDPSQIRTLLLPFGFDVVLGAPGLYIPQGGRVGGLLEYTGPVEGQIEGQIGGDVVFNRLTPTVPTLDRPNTIVEYGRELLREFTSLLVVGLLAWLITPNLWQRPIIALRLRPIPSFSFGLLGFILSFPVVFILVLITVVVVAVCLALSLEGVAAALALGLTVFNVTVGGTFYFVAIYLSRVVVGWAIGRFALRSIRTEMSATAYTLGSLALGIFVLAVGLSLPAVGWIINAVAVFLGLGALLLVATGQLQQMRRAPVPPAAPAGAQPAVLRVPLPITVIPTGTEAPAPSAPTLPLPGSEDAPGMSNLPPGFDPEKFFRD